MDHAGELPKLRRAQKSVNDREGGGLRRNNYMARSLDVRNTRSRLRSR